MKKWIVDNRLYFIGALIGAIAGFLYWKYIGCVTGTCTITSQPANASVYFAAMGAVFFGLFKRDKPKSVSPKEK